MVVLAQVLWVKETRRPQGTPSAVSDPGAQKFGVQELEFFAKSEFDTRRFSTTTCLMPKVHTEFSAYQERFRRLLGIDNERCFPAPAPKAAIGEEPQRSERVPAGLHAPIGERPSALLPAVNEFRGAQ